jgi:hypothetical protein
MTAEKYPPRKPKADKDVRAQAAEAERTDVQALPDGTAPPTEQQPAADQAPSREETVSVWTHPVTNQDEQEKITNAGGSDLPVPDN